VYLALIVASALWASLYTAAKPAVAFAGAAPVMLCRVTLAFACLTPMVLARGGLEPVRCHLRAHWRGIVLLGLLNFGLSQMLALSALNYLPASVNGVLNNTHPLWVAIGTAAFFPPRQPVLLVVGSLIALTGVIFVFVPDLAMGVSGVSAIGVALSLAGSGVIAIGTVIGRRVMRGSEPMTISALASGPAIVPVLLLTLASGGLGPIFDAPVSIKLLLVYVGVGCTAINFALWYYGLKHLPAAAASAFQYLIPPIGVALAAIFLDEPITIALLLGTACILVGLAATQIASTNVAISLRQRRQREAPLA
jgi:drug/metabolite transporter (DMT)-like permease